MKTITAYASRKSISATTKHLGKVTVHVGDRVRFVRLDGVVVEDVVRDCFYQTCSADPRLLFPAVVLTEHSWTALSSLVGITPKVPRKVQMHRSHKIDGVWVSFSRSIVGWIACFGPGRSVMFRQPIKDGVWTARQIMALENICTAQTLADAVRLVKSRYDAHDYEVETRIAGRLSGKAVR